MNRGRYTPGRVVMSLTRIWLPVLIALAGAVAIVLGHGRTSLAGAGVGLLIIALIVWMINWMFRLSVESNDDRDREEAAREYFDRHGHWPDEDQE
jgi:prepilin signal peptidase PulO-like enzyme (type II secretory pathway)